MQRRTGGLNHKLDPAKPLADSDLVRLAAGENDDLRIVDAAEGPDIVFGAVDDGILPAATSAARSPI